MASFLHQLTLSVLLIAISCSSFAKDKQLYYTGRHGNYTWPRRELSVSLDGDIVIGALHMVHERSEESTCGAIMSQGGIQALETMLYTLDEINRDPDLLPGIKLGTLAKDDCDRDIYGLEQAVDFIRAIFGLTTNYALLSTENTLVDREHWPTERCHQSNLFLRQSLLHSMTSFTSDNNLIVITDYV